MPGDSGVNLGTAYADIEVNFSKFNQNLDSALSSAERSLTSRLDGIGKNLQGIGSQLTLAFAPVTGFLVAGLKEFADYDAVLAEIEARTGATAEEMELVRQTALRMGQETAFSATDASQAMLELLSSGYDLNETMLALEPTLHAAAAGNMALGESADAITDILSQFQQDASQAAHVADVLAKSSGASSATMQEMVQAFSNVGPIANSFNLSIEDTAAILAQFAENGIKGADAGTQLKTMLDMMSRQTPEVQQMWADLGVSMYDTQGNVRDLNDVIEELNVAMDGMSDQERQDAITTLAGSYGQMGLTALLAADGFDTMAGKMDAAAGAAEVAEKQGDSFRAVINKLKNNILTLSVVALGPLAEDYLKPAAKALAGLTKQFTDFLVANPAVAEALGLFIAQLAIVGPLLYGFGTLLTMAGAVLAFLTSPIFLIVAALTLLVVAIRNNVLGLGDLAKGLAKTFDRIKEGANVFDALVVGLGFFVDDFAKALGKSDKTAREWQNKFTDAVRDAEDFLYNAANRVKTTASAIGTSIVEGLKEGVGAQWNTFYNWISGKIHSLIAQVKAVLGISSPSTVFMAIGQEMVAGLMAGLGDIWPLLAGLITSPLLKIIGNIWTLWAVFARLKTLVAFLPSLGISLGSLLGPLGILVALIAAFGLAYATNFMGFGDAVNSVAKIAMKGFNRILDVVGKVVEAFEEGGIAAALETAKDEILGLLDEAGQAFIGFIQNKLPGLLNQLAGMGSKLWGWIRESAPTLAFELGKALGQISKFIGDALVKYGPDILKALIGLNLLIYHWIVTTAIPELLGLAWDLATSFINGLVEGITGEQFSVQRALGEVLIGIWSGQYFSDAAGWVNNNIILPIVNAVTGFVAANGGLWNTAKMIGSTIFDAAASLITDVSSWVNTKIVTPLINAISSYVAQNGGLWNIAKNIGGNIMDAAAAGLAAQASINTWVWNNLIQPLITGIQSYVISNGGLWNIAKDIGNNIMDAAKAGVTALGTVATWVWNNIIQPIITGIQQYITANGGLWNIAKNIGSTLLDAAKDGITALGTVATWVWNNIIQPIITGIQAYVISNGGLWNIAKTIGSNILAAAVQGAGDIWGWVNNNIISPIISAISEYVAEQGGLWNVAMNIGSTIMNAAKTGLGDILAWVQTNITTPLGNMLTTLVAEGGGLWSQLVDVGKSIVDGLKQGVLDNWQAFEDWVADKVGGLINRFKDMLLSDSPSKVFMDIGGDIVAGLQIGVSDFSPVMNTMDALANAMQTPMDAMIGAQMQPAMAGRVTDHAPTSGNTYQITVQVTPPAEILNNPNQQMVQENAQLWGDTFGDKFMNVIRKDG